MTFDISFQIADPAWKKTVQKNTALFKRALNATYDALELPQKDFSVAVSFIDDAEIQELNAQYRAKNKPTNVLSFPMIDDFSDLGNFPGTLELGDIVMAFGTIDKEAYEQHKSIADHTAHLLVHGLLHLFGYDHMTKKEEREMEGLEIQILADLGIANPYL